MKYILPFCLFLSTSAIFAKGSVLPKNSCNNKSVVFSQSTSFGLNTSSPAGLIGSAASFNGQQNQSLNIPVSVDGRPGCWKQMSGMKFKTHSKLSKFSGDIEIDLPKSEFENIDETHMETYIYLDQNLSTDSNSLKSIQFDLVHFTCVGEETLSRESYSGNFENLKELQKMESINFSTVFATGAAAKQLAQQRNEIIKEHVERQESFGYTSRTPSRFVTLFQNRVGSPANVPPLLVRTKISKPSVLSLTSFSGNASYYSDFSTSQTLFVDVYGCSNFFRKTLDDYHISHFKEKMKSSDFDIDISSKKIRIHWGK